MSRNLINMLINIIKKLDLSRNLIYLCGCKLSRNLTDEYDNNNNMDKTKDIGAWLQSHDAISMNWIEKKLGITTGTLRRGRDIPDVYIERVGSLLSEYGFVFGVVVTSVVESKTVGEQKKGDVVHKPIGLIRRDKVVLDVPVDYANIKTQPVALNTDITEVIDEPVDKDTDEEEKPVKSDEGSESKTKTGISWSERQERLNNFKKNNGLF